MREQLRPTPLRALEVAEELMPEPLSDLAGLPTSVRVQSRLFDALVLLAAAREEVESGAELAWAKPEIGRLCHALDRLLNRFAS